MSEQNRGVTIAINHPPALFWAGAVIFSLFGFVWLALCAFVVWESGLWGLVVALVAAPVGVLYIRFGFSCLLWAAGRLHLTPERLCLRLFGREISSIPAGELGGLYVVQIRTRYSVYNGGYARNLGISGYSPSGLAQLREEQLKKGIFSRHNLPFRKSQADWQIKFAEEYLLRQCKWNQYLMIPRQILWLPWSEDLLALLLQMYPQTPVETVSEKIYYSMHEKWKDAQATRFCRGYEKKPGVPMAWVVFVLIFCLWPVVCIPLAPEIWPVAAIYAVFMTALFGGVMLIELPGVDELHLLPEGIRIRRGRREVLLPKSDLQAVIQCPDTSPRWGIRICCISREECVRRQVLWLQKSKNGRLWLQALQQLPDCDQRLLVGYCSRFFWNLGKKLAPVQRIAYTAQRAETLRQMYPEVLWIEEK